MSLAPHWYLWTLLVPVYFLAWSLLGAFAALESNWRRLAFTLGLGSAAAVLLTILSAPVTRSIGTSLGLAAGFSVLGSIFLWKKFPKSGSWRLQFSPWHVALFLWLGATLFLVARIAWRLDFHDQMRTQCHPAVVEAMLRGNFPPSLQVFPNIPLKYHFGGDLLATLFAYVFGLSGYRAIDFLQVFGWFSAALGLYALGRQLGWNRFLSFLGTQWILLAAGWLYLLKPWLGLDPALATVDYNWPDSYVIFQRYLNPGVISYFFQTPYCLGLPVFFTYLAMFHQWTQSRSAGLLTVCAILLGAFSLIHVTLFLGSLGCTLGILAIQPLVRQASWKRSLAEIAGVASAALAIALILGGFFTTSKDYASGLLVFHWPPGYLRHALDAGRAPISLSQAALWHLATLGSLCLWIGPAAVAALVLTRKNYRPMLIFFLFFAAGSFAFPQFFHYRLSWDIIKWFTAFQFGAIFLILSVAATIKRFRMVVFALLALSALLDTVPSYRLLYGLGILGPESYQGKQRGWHFARIPPRTPWVEFMDGLLRNQPWREMVLSSRGISDALSIYTGQAMASMDFNTIAFGVRGDLTRNRNSEIAALTTNFNLDQVKQGQIRWIFYGCKEFDQTFSEKAKNALQDAVFSQKAIEISVPPNLGCWKLYRLP